MVLWTPGAGPDELVAFRGPIQSYRCSACTHGPHALDLSALELLMDFACYREFPSFAMQRSWDRLSYRNLVEEVSTEERPLLPAAALQEACSRPERRTMMLQADEDRMSTDQHHAAKLSLSSLEPRTLDSLIPSHLSPFLSEKFRVPSHGPALLPAEAAPGSRAPFGSRGAAGRPMCTGSHSAGHPGGEKRDEQENC